MSERDFTATAFNSGIALYAAGEFWAAHEAWETLWRAETDPTAKTFFQGLIQVAAAMHKLFVMNHPASAARLLTRAMAKLAAFDEGYQGLALDTFRRAAAACIDALSEERATAGATRDDRARVPPLRLVISRGAST